MRGGESSERSPVLGECGGESGDTPSMPLFKLLRKTRKWPIEYFVLGCIHASFYGNTLSFIYVYLLLIYYNHSYIEFVTLLGYGKSPVIKLIIL